MRIQESQADYTIQHVQLCQFFYNLLKLFLMSEIGFQEQKKFVKLSAFEDSQQGQQIGVKNEYANHQTHKVAISGSNTKISKLIVLLLLGLILLFFLFNGSENSLPTQLQPEDTRNIKSLTFKKIFWLYTTGLFDGESMYEIIYLHHQNHTFHQQGYEVRFVNSWNAYDYISDNDTISRIGKTMQNSQIDEGVHNLLKLALLYQHGGVMINAKDTIIADDELSWIQDIFSTSQESKNEPAKAFLYGFNTSNPYNLSDIFIAAQPKNLLFKQAFDTLETLIRTGTHPHANETQILMRNEDRGIDYLPGGLPSIFSLVFLTKSKQPNFKHIDPKTYFSIQSLNHKNFIFANQLSRLNYHIFFKKYYKNQLGFNHRNGTKLLFNLNESLVTQFIQQKAMNLNIKDPQPLPQGSLIKKVLSAPHNKEVFIDPLPERQFSLCLVMMEDLNKQQIEVTKKAFLNQTYSNWKLVIPSLEANAGEQEFQRIKIFKGKSNKVHNTEVACTRHCDPKGYAVLLNFGEYFNSVEALSQIAETVRPRDTAAAIISLQISGRIQVQRDISWFSRNAFAMNNLVVQRLSAILNHVRIFSIQSFRNIHQMDFRDIYGKYFNDRLVFIMTLLEVVRNKINLPFHFYLAKKHINIMNIPVNVYYVNEKIAIKVNHMESVDLEQVKRLRPRLQCEEIRQSMIQITPMHVPFSKMFALNPGNDFVSVEDRQGPELIPKIIHQVWLGSKLTPARQYFYKKTQKMYPDYEVKLWREENITLQKFPLTYDVLQTLLKFNKRSPYNKLASVTDILRHQILYHEGGFWKDSGMNLLTPIFNKVLKYKLFLPVDKTFRYRWEQGMCIFGNMPRYQNLWRITNFRNINRMRIYDNYAMAVAGPIDFNQLLVGQQEYDPDIILMPYDTYYPAQLIQHPDGDLCTKRFEELNGATYQVEQNGWYLLSNCTEIYPFAYGVEHNRFGGTWNNRKTGTK